MILGNAPFHFQHSDFCLQFSQLLLSLLQLFLQQQPIVSIPRQAGKRHIRRTAAGGFLPLDEFGLKGVSLFHK
jgi:hypothetical protein